MQQTISFVLDGNIQTLDFNEQFSPTTTVLNFLRQSNAHKGVKEGCAEGDCGACTLVIGELNQEKKITYKAMDSCLVFLPMIHGKQLITVENLKQQKDNTEILHPVQQQMVDCNGSQCGYCTPGFIMSMFALYKNENNPPKETIEDALTGNLCRCTGYKPIIEATAKACIHNGEDQFVQNEKQIIDLLLQIKNSSNSILISTDTQKYYQPKTKAEAFELRNKILNSVLISGATDVALRVTKRHEILEEIIDLSNIEELKKCTRTDYLIKFGAGMSLEDVKQISKNELPALHETLAVFGSKQIRTLATFGGNLGSGSPIGDTLPVLMAYHADIKLQSTDGDRIVKMNKFILGYRQTERKPNEIITSVIINKPAANTKVKFYKVSKRKDLDISTVSAGFSVTLKNNKVDTIILAYGGMAAITKRATEAEVFLTAHEWTRENVEQAMEMIQKAFTPISDARSGAEFRIVAAKNLLLKFWIETSNIETTQH
jgi:xanthine dehydrogenase small subunit